MTYAYAPWSTQAKARDPVGKCHMRHLSPLPMLIKTTCDSTLELAFTPTSHLLLPDTCQVYVINKDIILPSTLNLGVKTDFFNIMTAFHEVAYTFFWIVAFHGVAYMLIMSS